MNAASLGSGIGSGAIEGHPDRIPLVDIHTGLCEGYLPMLFDDDGACLDLGRDERLFTDRQKVALAVRDGGCLDPDCTRPPSWTEAHHIDHWQRDGGRTDLADGILLCRRDHLRYHNQGWEVRRTGADYWLIPPAGVDPAQTPRAMRPKTPARHPQSSRSGATRPGTCRSGAGRV
ncbi:HNH endonuclease signature motif containing protein [Agromyces sp. NPDC056965]|uniref:HNH endonuclease signature motif containing protein n=1 Tax=Agromyces sp. NPDC056965 TaxID=3345983 RepID=UPI003641D063